MSALAAATTDPTLDALKQLDDPALWIVKENVPIFVPHERKGPDGKLEKVDVARLQKVADVINARERERGVLPILFDGHRKPGQSQKSQPEIYGVARNARVGTFGPENAPALLSRFYYRKDTWDEARKYPFRSPEFWAGSNQITGIALLKTDPVLDMGMLSYERDDGAYFYAMPGAIDLADAPASAAADETQKQLTIQALSPPSGVLQMADTEKKPETPVQMARDEQIAMYERQVADLKAINTQLTEQTAADRARIEALEKVNRLALYERDLTELKQLHYQFDLKEELADVADLSPEHFERHKKRIRERYQRLPIGNQIRLGDLPEPVPRNPSDPPPKHAEIMHYMRLHPGLSYEHAEAAIVHGQPAAAK